MKELDEKAEAERQHGEFVPYVATDGSVYSAADEAGVMPELKGLLASRTVPEVLARVLSRRLGRQVLVEPPDDDVPLPLLRWDNQVRTGSEGGEPMERLVPGATEVAVMGARVLPARTAGWTCGYETGEGGKHEPGATDVDGGRGSGLVRDQPEHGVRVRAKE